MAKKLEEFTTKTPTTGDFIYLTRPGDKAAANDVRDEGKTTAELVARVANPRGFTAARIDSRLLQSASPLTADGWYKIAETTLLNTYVFSANFVCSYRATLLECMAQITNSSVAKTHINSRIEILGRSLQTEGQTASLVSRFRIGKSDSINTAGAVLEVYVDTTIDDSLTTQMTQGMGLESAEGWDLVEPALSDGFCADGSTAATYLEAGEEMSYENSNNRFAPNLSGFTNTNDKVRCSVLWPEIPKQGTGLTITLPTTSLLIRDGQGNSATVTGAHTISNFTITGNIVEFDIDEIGIFAGLNSGPCGALFSGTGMKLTIT